MKLIRNTIQKVHTAYGRTHDQRISGDTDNFIKTLIGRVINPDTSYEDAVQRTADVLAVAARELHKIATSFSDTEGVSSSIPETTSRDRLFIEALEEMYQGHHSDVTEMCSEYLDHGTMPHNRARLCRFVEFDVPHGAVRGEFDVFTYECEFYNSSHELIRDQVNYGCHD